MRRCTCIFRGNRRPVLGQVHVAHFLGHKAASACALVDTACTVIWKTLPRAYKVGRVLGHPSCKHPYHALLPAACRTCILSTTSYRSSLGMPVARASESHTCTRTRTRTPQRARHASCMVSAVHLEASDAHAGSSSSSCAPKISSQARPGCQALCAGMDARESEAHASRHFSGSECFWIGVNLRSHLERCATCAAISRAGA